jgi:Ras-related protein Rab-1A
MARQIKERMGSSTAQNKEKINIGQGQSVNTGSGNGCC